MTLTEAYEAAEAALSREERRSIVGESDEESLARVARAVVDAALRELRAAEWLGESWR